MNANPLLPPSETPDEPLPCPFFACQIGLDPVSGEHVVHTGTTPLALRCPLFGARVPIEVWNHRRSQPTPTLYVKHPDGSYSEYRGTTAPAPSSQADNGIGIRHHREPVAVDASASPDRGTTPTLEGQLPPLFFATGCDVFQNRREMTAQRVATAITPPFATAAAESLSGGRGEQERLYDEIAEQVRKVAALGQQFASRFSLLLAEIEQMPQRSPTVGTRMDGSLRVEMRASQVSDDDNNVFLLRDRVLALIRREVANG